MSRTFLVSLSLGFLSVSTPSADLLTPFCLFVFGVSLAVYGMSLALTVSFVEGGQLAAVASGWGSRSDWLSSLITLLG
ncbi:MAG: hypothetical protein ACE5H0_07000 [Bacteroidota bacterium]